MPQRRRNTTTGAVLEAMIIPSLKRGGYSITTQVNIGERISGRRHFVDAVAEKEGKKYLISLKWQQVSGTAEQKVPFEVICLLDAVIKSEGEYEKAYLVLGGEGWTLRDFYVGGGLEQFLQYADKVDLLTLESFIAVANEGQL